MHRFLNVAGKESSGKYSVKVCMFVCRSSKIGSQFSLHVFMLMESWKLRMF